MVAGGGVLTTYALISAREGGGGLGEYSLHMLRYQPGMRYGERGEYSLRML